MEIPATRTRTAGLLNILYNSSLMFIFAVDERIAPLVITIKTWAKSHDINSAFKGSLSSYCLVTMVSTHSLLFKCLDDLLEVLSRDINCITSGDLLPANGSVSSHPASSQAVRGRADEREREHRPATLHPQNIRQVQVS